MSYLKNLLAVEILKGRALWALLLTLASSCSGPCSDWCGESAVGTPCSFNSTRLYLPPANELTGLELDFVQMKDGLRLYINVYGLEIPPEADNSAYSRVFISYRTYAYHFSAQRFQGGQRLLIPQYVQSEIVDFLQEGQPVSIQVGRYKSDIYPDKFLDLFYRMVNTAL